ncbi:MFS transporter [Actinoplanes sp. KI2]|uniref:MFS transporter n=1 Tax=Actinoplanes sp. KI2 TaxID=2983315 RepID=UPI0021D5EA93|nr:MFS transporter [Actinoplanes sp. KI2]MCU7727509.1 MFS transporter [Actinoplanes sp. KI2]
MRGSGTRPAREDANDRRTATAVREIDLLTAVGPVAAARARSARWRLTAVCAAWGLFWGAWSGLIPAVQQRVGVTAGTLGLLLTFVAVGAIPAMALTGRLARGREPAALAAGTMAFGVTIAALAAASSPVLLGLCLVAVGMTSGMLDVCLSLAIARAERSTGARLFQPVHAAFPLLVVVAAPLAGLTRQLGVPLPVLLLIVGLLVAGVGALAPAGLNLAHPTGGDDRAERAARHRRRLRWVGIGVGALGACMLIMENAVEQWSALLLEDYRHASPLLASSAPAVYYLALSLGRLAAQAVPRLRTRGILAFGAVGGGVGIVVAGIAPHAPLGLAAFALTGFAFGPVIPALLSYAATRDSDGAVVATATTTSYSGFVASPLVVAGLSALATLPLAIAALGTLALPLLIVAFAGRFAESRPAG